MGRSFLTRLSHLWTKPTLGGESILDTGSGFMVMTHGTGPAVHSRVLIISGPESIAIRMLDHKGLPEKSLLLRRNLAHIATGDESDTIEIRYPDDVEIRLGKLARPTQKVLLDPTGT